MATDGQALDVFKDKIGCVQFRHDAHKLPDKRIARIVQNPMADKGKPLAGSAAEDDIDLSRSDVRLLSNIFCRQYGNGLSEYRTVGKIVLVDGCVNRIDFDSGDNIEASLFEAEAEPSCSGE